MNQKNIIPLILSTLAGALAALAVCAFFFFYHKPAPPAEKPFAAEAPTPVPAQPKTTEFPTRKIMLSDVDSVSISTVYTGFYETGSECGKSRNPAPKADDSISLSYSPCRTVLTFNRGGGASKTTSVKRPGNSVNAPEKEEKSEWHSKISAEQFETLLKGVAGNADFIEWRNVLITHSNCTIYAYHKDGMIQLPMYLDIKRGSAFAPLVDSFKELDGKIVWKKV
jgi:hypothetical protein